MAPTKSLATLKKERQILLVSLNYFKDYLETIQDSGTSESSTNELEGRFTNFKEKFGNFQIVGDAILSATIDTPEFDDEVERNREDLNHFYELYGRAMALCRANDDSHSVSSDYTQATSMENLHPTSGLQIKLPAIELPSFNGNHATFSEFHNTFKALVHDNPSLSSVQKLHYLRSCLKGQAAEVISSIAISEENYAIAWDLLVQRYQNRRRIIETYLNAIFALPTLTKFDSAKSLSNLYAELQKNLKAIAALDLDTRNWDVIIIHVVKGKLTTELLKEWESSIDALSDDLPTIEQFLEFLLKESRVQEAVQFSSSNIKAGHHAGTGQSRNKMDKKGTCLTSSIKNKPFFAPKTPNCPFCKRTGHNIANCESFISLSIPDRISEIYSRGLCNNCLSPGHRKLSCTSKFRCTKCHKRHNTMLHMNSHDLGPQKATNTFKKDAGQNSVSNVNFSSARARSILLATAVVIIYDTDGNPHKFRALLDNGSESNFISENARQQLKLRKLRSSTSLAGIGGAQLTATHFTNCTIHSCHTPYKKSLDFIILPKLTQNLPSQTFDLSQLDIPRDINLADPNFNISCPIDLIIGAELFFSLLCVGQITLRSTPLILAKTKLGWIVSGPIPMTNSSHQSHHTKQSFHVCELESNIKRFWELESVKPRDMISAEEKKVEALYNTTTVRLPDGSYQTDLPFNGSEDKLGSNFYLAKKRFLNLEQKMGRDPKIREEYTQFIKEYIDLGHMEKSNTQQSSKGFYLPHHCVIKKDALTTKLRVVFDGSCKTDSGVSLNDVLMVGPTIQQDLMSILMRFRTHKIAIHADIQKMYRMVKINPEHRQFQKILWRDSPSENISTYELNTVTYGTASASFSAIRTLKQLTLDEGNSFSPDTVEKVSKDFYVDDLLSGGNDLVEVNSLVQEVSRLLELGNFKLHKWYSNNSELFRHDGDVPTTVVIDSDDHIKTLGLLWQPSTDKFIFCVQTLSDNKVTKRTILSNIGKIFDPLGLINPLTLRAKLIMQELWQANLSWDESLPQALHTGWLDYTKDLSKISSLSIDRRLSDLENPCKFELHGFCDSSELAYAACVYVVSEDKSGKRSSSLVSAKSRVAPLKKISLPRLELCGAVLLSELYLKVKEALHNIHFESEYFWSDSQIVLCWIASPSSKFKTFVANRIGEIHENTNPGNWKHVASSANPADLSTRGMSAENFSQSSLWFHGPQWLLAKKSEWPSSILNTDISLPEQKESLSNTCVHIATCDNFHLLEKYSNFGKLQRVTAYCMRFSRNCQSKLNASRKARKSGPLDLEELENANMVLIKLAQALSFPDEIKNLSMKKAVPQNSKVFNLNPFTDERGIIRVGGRVGNSELTFDQKFPILLPASHLSHLLLAQSHNENLHCGVQALIANIRLKYWPLNVKNMARAIVHKCIPCFKAKPKVGAQLMGNLPEDRIRPSRPFSVTGVDYLGPIMIKSGYTRKSPAMKSYVALFVCFSTKAIHLELVSDLTTQAFIATLHRFISRRGKPSRIYSDNATNFQGASNEFQKLRITEHAASQSIEWKFIPANSPHFGGLWEAGVKSVKHHLKRVTTDALLHYEEMNTLLCKIESILNSRPLTPLSNDPNDLSYLSPGHFLIGDVLKAQPERNVSDVSMNRLTRWQRVQQISQHFWNRWSKEYINQLRQRTKWHSPTTSLTIGRLVVIKDDSTPSTKWPMGRVISTHAGKDGHVRVATVKTVSGTFKRCIQKLCPLPIE